MMTAGATQNAHTKHKTKFNPMPNFQPSFFASGLPSSIKLGVATHVLRKSIPRANKSTVSNKRYRGLPNGEKSSIYAFLYTVSGATNCGSVVLIFAPLSSIDRKKHDR